MILKGHAFSLICTAVVSHDTKVVGEQVFRAPLSYQCDTHTHTLTVHCSEEVLGLFLIFKQI